MVSINKLLLKGLNPNSKLIREYKNSLGDLSRDQLEASIGLMLGDASLQTQNKGKTYRLKFEWSNKHKSYLDHVSILFDEWILSPPHNKTRLSPKENTIINWGLQTISHKAFNVLADLFITDNVKRIKPNLIKDNLTGRGLAYWFMDDGGKLDYNKNSKNKSIVLNTQSFLDSEVAMMAQELTDKFNLNCSLRNNKNKKVIVIDASSYLKFRELVDPHIITDMLYKLP
jgi:hypothetical protein